MTARLRLLVLSPLVLIVLLSAAVFPLAVLAEEATPPPPELTEATSAEDAPPVDVAEGSSTEEAPPPAPTELSGAAGPALTEAAPVEAPTDNLAAAVPEGTDVVVLDEDGNALPLASNEAAEIIANGDPMWCPDGVAPGGAGCTGGSLTISGGASDTGLANNMLFLAQDNCQGATPASWCGGAGTIYIAADYDTDNETWWPSLDIDDYEIGDTGVYYFGDLTIQGGWDFSQDADHQPAGAISTFNKPFSVDWIGNLTLNDLIFEQIDTVGGMALTLETTGDITLDHVQVLDNDGVGAFLDNCGDDGSGCTGTGSISITDSKFDRNYGPDGGSPRNGLSAYSSGNITLTRVEANENDWTGADLHAFGSGASLISITDSTFSGNFLQGLIAEGGSILLDTVQVAENGRLYGAEGAVLDNCFTYGSSVTCPGDGYISILDSTFEHNGDTGLIADSVGDISITSTRMEHNGWVDLDGDGVMDAGETPGLDSYGAILDNCLYDDDLEGCAGSGVIEITESLFNGNQAAGLKVYSSGAISMILSEASANGVEADPGYWDRGGAALNNEDAEGTPGIIVDGSDFFNNAGVGLFAHSLGDIQLTDSTANGNGDAAIGSWDMPSPIGAGALLDNCALFMYATDEWGCRGSGNVTVENSLFTENAETGLYVETFGAITLSEVHANSNGVFGAELMNDRMGTGGSRSTGGITITGPSTFGTQWEPNGGTGLWFDSYGNVTLSDIVASYNGFADVEDMYAGYGINGYTEGEGVSISLSNVTANANVEDGLMLGAYGVQDGRTGQIVGGSAAGITLIDVVASANGYDGADITSDGSVLVDSSTFNGNGYDGLFIGADSAVVECSTFFANVYDGLTAAVDGTVTVAGCTLFGNGDEDINVWEGQLAITDGDCEGSGGGGDTGGGGDGETEPPAPPTTPTLNVVPNVGEQQMVELACTGIAGTVLQLANGDHIELPCPIEGSATLHHQGEDTLPAALDGGLTYVSSMHLGMAPDPEAVQGLGGSIGLHFVVPSDMQQATLVVLHWDNGQWEQLSGSLSADGFFETPHGQTGIYVLATG